jgi:DNA invertase Pin-like site-specific DNA recombinase
MDRTYVVAFLRRDPSGRPSGERRVIAEFARRGGFEVVAELSEDSDVTILDSSGFARALTRIERTRAKIIVVASATSFARDSLVQAVGRAKLSRSGIQLVAADGSAFGSDLFPTNLIEQVIDQASAFDKLVRISRAKTAYERRRIKVGPNWRKQYVDMFPEAVRAVKELYDNSRRAGARMSLREISARVAEAGHFKRNGKPFHPWVIDRMIKGPNPRPAKHEGP